MSALSASVIGGPLTMSFIALESTGNLWLTTAVLVAVIISTQITRELFGYSFATWRLHLRGETIRSAADIGWIRDLTVRSLMRPDVATVNANMPIERIPRQISAGLEDPGGRGRRQPAAMSGSRWWPTRMRRMSRRPNGLIGILHYSRCGAASRHEHPGSDRGVRRRRSGIARRGRNRRRTPADRRSHRGPRHAALCGRIRAAAARGGGGYLQIDRPNEVGTQACSDSGPGMRLEKRSHFLEEPRKAGSLSSSTWFWLSSGTRRAPGCPRPAADPNSNGTLAS